VLVHRITVSASDRSLCNVFFLFVQIDSACIHNTRWCMVISTAASWECW